MGLKGTLQTFHLASLLQLFSSEQKTGVLQLKKATDEINIFFKDGIIVYASSEDKDLRLGKLLITKGLLTESQLEESLQLAQAEGVKLGAILVRKRYISAKTLTEMLRHQVKELLYSLFFWDHGDFRFKDVPIDVEGKLITRMNTMEVVLEASRRIDEWSVIRRHIPSDDMVFQISEGRQDRNEVKLNKEEWGILKFIDGRKTITDLQKKSGHEGFTLYKSLCSLMLSGLIEAVEAPPKGETSQDLALSTIITIYDDVFKTILEDLQAQLGNRALELFDTCKAQLLPEQQAFFKDYRPRTGTGDKKPEPHGLESYGQSDNGRAMLIHCFNTLLQLLMTKEMETLGTGLTSQTLEKTRQRLAHVKEYQKTSDQSQEVFARIESILGEIADKVAGGKAKSAGILSFMRKRGAGG